MAKLFLADDGRGNYGNPKQHKDAGKSGGEATKANQDDGFYEEIGSMSNQDGNNPGNFANRPTEEVKEAGREGGRSRGNDSGRNDS